MRSGECVFEVKLKWSEEETDKRQTAHPPLDDRERLTATARDCFEQALGDIGLEIPSELEASLTMSFNRITFAARKRSQRLTCDLGVRLSGAHGQTAAMKDGLVLVATKSEAGDSPVDDMLARMGMEPISLSKYRVGVSLVGAVGFGDQPGSDLFR